MTQAADLGAVANQTGALYRTRQNQGIQAVVTQHYGASEPPVVYPNMIWFSSGDGYIKVRSPTNTSWQNIGTIGPPLTWTNINIPAEGFVTGDIKGSYNQLQPSGWLLMNDGTIGNQSSGAQSRANPDCFSLFSLLWSVSADDWCSVYAASTLTRTGRGGTALSDWNANRHIALPKMYGRVPGAAGWGSGLSNLGVATWIGAEYVVLDQSQIPAHAHSFSATLPNHTHGMGQFVNNQGPSHGGGVFGEGVGNLQITSGNTDGIVAGASSSGTTSTYGAGAAHFNVQPTTYCFYFIKL